MIAVQLVLNADGKLNIASAVDGAPPGTVAPDSMVKAMLLQAWEMMLTKGIYAEIQNQQRVKLAGADEMPPHGNGIIA